MKDGGWAYPGECEDFGMSMRQSYKLAALKGLLAESEWIPSDYPLLATQCGKIADAMLDEDAEHERENRNE